MNKQLNVLFSVLIKALTVLTVMVLAFVIYFTIKEALPTFDKVAVPGFLLDRRWMPIAYTGEPSFGISNFIAVTFYVSLTTTVLAVIMRVGAAIYLSYAATQWMRGALYPFMDPLIGIPSVTYGFMGLAPMVRLFIRAGVHTGSCVLVTGILSAVMLLPFLIPSCNETMLRVGKRCQPAVNALDISKRHMVTTTVLPGSQKNILLSTTLATGRAMGGIMAVMMVIGNANLFPFLLDKSESIAAMIVSEIGTAVVGSTRYRALYAAGLVLALLLFLIDSDITLLRSKLEQQTGTIGRNHKPEP